MKKLMLLSLLSTFIFYSCSDDDSCTTYKEDNGNLVTPDLSVTLSDTQSPMTGVLEAYPCQAGGAIYYGNYIEGKLTPFPGMYYLQNGEIYGDKNREISLPVGTYNMIYWGRADLQQPGRRRPPNHYRRRPFTTVFRAPESFGGYDLLSGIRLSVYSETGTYRHGRTECSHAACCCRAESNRQKQKQRYPKFQYCRHGSTCRRHCREAEHVYSHSGQPNQNSIFPACTVGRRYTDEQCHGHAFSIIRQTNVQADHQA